MFAEQATGLLAGGVDLVIIETTQDILELKAAVFGVRRACRDAGRAVPIQCSVSLLPQGGKMLLGTDISSALATIEGLGVDALGPARRAPRTCVTIRFLGSSARPGPPHPQCRIPIQGPQGETIFPSNSEPLATCWGVRRALRRRNRRRLLRHDAGAHPALAERVKGSIPPPRPAARASHAR